MTKGLNGATYNEQSNRPHYRGQPPHRHRERVISLEQDASFLPDGWLAEFYVARTLDGDYLAQSLFIPTLREYVQERCPGAVEVTR